MKTQTKKAIKRRVKVDAAADELTQRQSYAKRNLLIKCDELQKALDRYIETCAEFDTEVAEALEFNYREFQMLTPEQAKFAKKMMEYWTRLYRQIVDIQQPITIFETLTYAKLAHKGYPQYDGAFDGTDWKVYRAKRNLSTKTGYRVANGEHFVGRAGEIEGKPSIVLLIFGNQVYHTHFNPKHFEEIKLS